MQHQFKLKAKTFNYKKRMIQETLKTQIIKCLVQMSLKIILKKRLIMLKFK